MDATVHEGVWVEHDCLKIGRCGCRCLRTWDQSLFAALLVSPHPLVKRQPLILSGIKRDQDYVSEACSLVVSLFPHSYLLRNRDECLNLLYSFTCLIAYAHTRG